MTSLNINIDKIFGFVSKEEVNALQDKVKKSLATLYDKSGKGNDFLGWLNLPSSINEAEFKDIESTAASLAKMSEVVVVVGIGGSYLGSKAVIDALSHSFLPLQSKRSHPMVLFAGQNIGEDYHNELFDILNERDYSIIVISKSGTTTEPALAFRLLKQHIEAKYGKDTASKRIVAITDKSKGALRILATNEGYKTFVISDDIGGRYSVFTPVGLLPIAVAGFDIRQLIFGAKQMEELTGTQTPYDKNPALQYAAARNALYAKGKTTEILVNYNPKLHNVAEWWKQLYGESEGKEGKGIFPAAVDFSSDLHSMGQYIQEGLRNIFETVISIDSPNSTLKVPTDKDNLDGLNFLANKRIDEVNHQAELGTLLAHIDGGVPNIRISVEKLNEFNIGQLLYFFEVACGISGYTLGINPFDQPGVEAYKKNMFALLNKPGYEKEGEALRKRLV